MGKLDLKLVVASGVEFVFNSFSGLNFKADFQILRPEVDFESQIELRGFAEDWRTINFFRLNSKNAPEELEQFEKGLGPSVVQLSKLFGLDKDKQTLRDIFAKAKEAEWEIEFQFQKYKPSKYTLPESTRFNLVAGPDGTYHAQWEYSHEGILCTKILKKGLDSNFTLVPRKVYFFINFDDNFDNPKFNEFEGSEIFV
eukprot:GHVP01067268.1.p1 GENE.GHVP01067268.1~~GHVP01067268.1.p1  ORF type:complete len:198 (-),score=36.77 GHVP01067268.1:142-735(-)